MISLAEALEEHVAKAFGRSLAERRLATFAFNVSRAEVIIALHNKVKGLVVLDLASLGSNAGAIIEQ